MLCFLRALLCKDVVGNKFRCRYKKKKRAKDHEENADEYLQIRPYLQRQKREKQSKKRNVQSQSGLHISRTTIIRRRRRRRRRAPAGIPIAPALLLLRHLRTALPALPTTRRRRRGAWYLLLESTTATTAAHAAAEDGQEDDSADGAADADDDGFVVVDPGRDLPADGGAAAPAVLARAAAAAGGAVQEVLVQASALVGGEFGRAASDDAGRGVAGGRVVAH